MMIGIMVGVIVTIATMVWLSGWYIICLAISTNMSNEEVEESHISMEDRYPSRANMEDMDNLDDLSFDDDDEDCDFSV